MKVITLACLAVAAGALFSNSPALADIPKPDPKKVAADSAAGVASGVGHWGDEMSKIFKNASDPGRRKSEIDSKNKTMKDGMLLLPCVATSDVAGSESGVKKLVIDQLEQKNVPLDVEVHAACNSNHKWLIDIKFAKFLKEVKVIVSGVTPMVVAKAEKGEALTAKIDATKKSVEGIAGKWEADISLWVDKLIHQPDCGRACKDQITVSTEVAAKNVHALDCDPGDRSNTLPNSTVSSFSQRVRNLVKGNRKLIQLSATCEAGKLVLKPEYAW